MSSNVKLFVGGCVCILVLMIVIQFNKYKQSEVKFLKTEGFVAEVDKNTYPKPIKTITRINLNHPNSENNKINNLYHDLSIEKLNSQNISQSIPGRTQTKLLTNNKNNISNNAFCNHREYGNNYPVTSIHSFPGAGNTWTRYLIERATGGYTGSVYLDRDLRKTFPGEKLVIADFPKLVGIKSHNIGETGYTCRTEQALFDMIHHNKNAKCVILLRNPFHAILSEYKRVTTHSHTGSAKNTQAHVEKYIKGFQNFGKIGRWIKPRYLETYRTSHDWCQNKLVVFYEKLKEDTAEEVKKIAKFLETNEHKFDEVRFDRCIRKNEEFEGKFHRKTSLKVKKVDPFTDEHRKLVLDVVLELNKTYESIPYSYLEF